ncbi:MAG: N-acetylglucosamine-specific PTS transporter subunit IIBC [Brevinema sp.]
MFNYLQRIGKALMVPVSVLPAAAVLMGIGYWIDPVGWGADNTLAAFLIKSGSSLIDHMGILFAVGVAFGLSREQDGPAALAGLVAWLIVTTLLSPGSVAALQGIPVDQVSAAFYKINNQFIGILCGVVASATYNKFYRTELPAMLAFFSGKRLVPILTAVFMIAVSYILMFIWPYVYGGLIKIGVGVASLGAIGAGIFGFLNRILIPVGLHHALNAVFWFDVAGINDIGNFWGNTGVKGVTGMYQAGFFPIMMFGLVGAVMAFIHTAKPEQRSKVRSIFVAAAFASFFTGITEPIEFSFMFLAPGLYLIHALLTGLSLFLAAQFQWMAGFGFSAGLVDFVLSSRLPMANNPYFLLLQGLVFFVVYYVLFKTLILKFDIKTLGRDDADILADDSSEAESSESKHAQIAAKILKGLGGSSNIKNIEYCATRLRLEVANSSIIDEATIKSVSSGVIKPSATNVQVIIGPTVEFVATELKKLV